MKRISLFLLLALAPAIGFSQQTLINTRQIKATGNYTNSFTNLFNELKWMKENHLTSNQWVVLNAIITNRFYALENRTLTNEADIAELTNSYASLYTMVTSHVDAADTFSTNFLRGICTNDEVVTFSRPFDHVPTVIGTMKNPVTQGTVGSEGLTPIYLGTVSETGFEFWSNLQSVDIYWMAY